MKHSKSGSLNSMPSVVVLIPSSDGDLGGAHSALTSSPELRYVRPRSNLVAPSSSSSPPKSTSALASSAALCPPRPPLSISRRTLLASPSSSSPSSSSPSLSRHPSASSRSFPHAFHASNVGHTSRSSHHDHPIDLTDPFGPDAFMSARRSPAVGQKLYLCQWRLRDKKGVLDPNGHTFCHCRLVTADLLAKHVLTQHIAADWPPPTHALKQKIACKWGGCFNRRYDASGLAAHLVNDHLTNQMGLKYACVANHCSDKTLLTSFEALARHHAKYHASTTHPNQVRPIWQPIRVRKDAKHESHLLAAIRQLDAIGPTIPKIAVSASANPKIPPISEHARTLNQIELKRRCFDPLDVHPGEGQDGQPWLRFYRRIEKQSDYEADLQAAHDAIFRSTTYDQNGLERLLPLALDCVELAHEPTLRAIQQGLQHAQIYDACAPSSLHPKKPHPPGRLSLPIKADCQVLITQRSPEHFVETIGPASLSSIEREMNFDASLSKQCRWVDEVLKLRPATPRSGTTAPTRDPPSDVEGDFGAVSMLEWAPQLWLDPYHPSSRCRFPIAEDAATHENPQAIQRRAGTPPEKALPSSNEYTASSRRVSPSGHVRSSSLTPASRSGSIATSLGSNADNNTTLLDGYGSGFVLPSSRIKLEDKGLIHIDLTGGSEQQKDARPKKRLRSSMSPLRPSSSLGIML